MRGYQNPFLHRGNVTDQRGIALRVTVGRPPTLTKNIILALTRANSLALSRAELDIVE